MLIWRRAALVGLRCQGSFSGPLEDEMQRFGLLSTRCFVQTSRLDFCRISGQNKKSVLSAQHGLQPFMNGAGVAVGGRAT